jgi:hypothetical protein
MVQNLTLTEKLAVLEELCNFGESAAKMSDAQLADEIVDLRQFKKIIEAREKLLCTILKGRYEAQIAAIQDLDKKFVRVEGLHNKVIIKTVVQTRLDTEAIKNDMDEDWISEHSKTIEFLQIDVVKDAGA